MVVKKTDDFNTIFEVLKSLKFDFFSNEAREDSFIRKLSKKYSENADFYFFDLDGIPIALVSFYSNNTSSKCAFLSMIVVSQKYKGKGLGRMLMNIMFNQLKEKDFNYVQLEVSKNNRNAIKFYEKLGFKKSTNSTTNSYYYEMKVEDYYD